MRQRAYLTAIAVRDDEGAAAARRRERPILICSVSSALPLGISSSRSKGARAVRSFHCGILRTGNERYARAESRYRDVIKSRDIDSGVARRFNRLACPRPACPGGPLFRNDKPESLRPRVLTARRLSIRFRFGAGRKRETRRAFASCNGALKKRARHFIGRVRRVARG